MYLHELKIGSLKLENNIFLAPMAGITDLPFRIICREHGTSLAFSEMVSSKAICYNDEKTKKLMNIKGEKKPVAIQIFGSDYAAMANATKYVSDIADIIDINMGCPAPKVTKNGDGSKLLLDLEKARSIIQSVVKNSKVPVTIKIRTGWDKQNIVATEIAKIAEQEGISAITVHGRTRSDYYSGKADLNLIKEVKQSVNIPVIGNGDIINEETAAQMFEKTGVDGIMIGRGAFGNPWIFEKIIHFLETGEKLQDVPLNEKLDIIKEHLKLLIKEKGEYVAIREFRKHLAAYSKGLPNAAEFRTNVNQIENEEELIKYLEFYFENIKE